ncbi:hypothetical protein T03_17778 [Trichinella britovi]|uniref:Uncharacterized protein n=1 Tax=Trichinella britovi TaxID=45882 RepID=A0A0V1DHU3_TRIBR|nr:hypothetical protein T03_17778 [Trichinella britovi]
MWIPHLSQKVHSMKGSLTSDINCLSVGTGCGCLMGAMLRTQSMRRSGVVSVYHVAHFFTVVCSCQTSDSSWPMHRCGCNPRTMNLTAGLSSSSLKLQCKITYLYHCRSPRPFRLTRFLSDFPVNYGDQLPQQVVAGQSRQRCSPWPIHACLQWTADTTLGWSRTLYRCIKWPVELAERPWTFRMKLRKLSDGYDWKTLESDGPGGTNDVVDRLQLNIFASATVASF